MNCSALWNFVVAFRCLGLGVGKVDTGVHPGLEFCQINAMKRQRTRASRVISRVLSK